MTTIEYVKLRQKYWAKKKNIALQGSAVERGDAIYTKTLEDNLFRMLSDSTKKSILLGDGNELGNDNKPGKMQALHSSSALGINVFEYWKTEKRFKPIAKALSISTLDIKSIEFEEKYEIFKNAKKHPNIDVNIHYNSNYLVGVECKYTEPFQFKNENSGLKETYINDLLFWNEFPSLKKLALEVSPSDEKYEYLHCAQLIKHVLGMFTQIRDKSKFMLMYIYQPAYFENNCKYEEELQLFENAMLSDGIKFRSITWQEVMCKLIDNTDDEDKNYMNYITERYL